MDEVVLSWEGVKACEVRTSRTSDLLCNSLANSSRRGIDALN